MRQDSSRPLGRRAVSHLLALEPRMMFDAAMAATTAEVSDAAAADHGPADAGHDAPHAATVDGYDRDMTTHDTRQVEIDPGEAAAAPPRDIIFIDTAVADYQSLANAWADRGEVILIDRSSDGLAQVQAALAGRHDIAAIHIVSHGSEGVLMLGTTRIDQAGIDGALAGRLAAIGGALTPDGDILVYGCDFADGTDGARAIDALARATGADIAASTDPTGGERRGGDWTLEAHRGDIEARSLDGGDWNHLLAPVAIVIKPDSLTVRQADGTIVADDPAEFNQDGNTRSPNVGAGAYATWADAATYNGRSVDLRATIVNLTAGDAIRFTRPISGTDDAAFLIASSTNSGTAQVEIRWELLEAGTDIPVRADVRFTIADIDGVGGNTHTRETVLVGTEGLSYFTRDASSDIRFASTNQQVEASGTQNELANPPEPISAASFDWTDVAGFTITYQLNRAGSQQAQFIHDGDADFKYDNPIYTSIPRLDLDANDSTATGTGAAFDYQVGGPGVRVVDTDVSVDNPMGAVTGAVVKLTDAKTGDQLTAGTLPAGITASTSTSAGVITLTLSGNATAADYATALRTIRFANSQAAPDLTTRTIDVSYTNTALTSPVATSRIAINRAPVAVNDSASTPEDRAVTITVLGNDSDPDGDALTVLAATASHGTVVRNADGTLTYTPDANYNGTDSIAYTIGDGRGGTASATVALRVAPQADTPEPVVPARQAMAEDGTLTFSTGNGNALVVRDVDGGAQTVTVAVTRGVFTLGRTTGLSFSAGDGTADRTMTFTGSLADVNAALQNAVYRPDADANGAAGLTLTTARVPVEGEVFQNGELEQPSIPRGGNRTVDQDMVPGWRTTASDGLIEIWSSGFNGVTAYEGQQFFEINATQSASLFQEFRSTAGSNVVVDFAHRGRAGVDTMRLIATDLGADGVYGTADDVVLSQADYSDGNTAWGQHSHQIVTAASGNVIRVAFESIATASGTPTIGNFLDAVAVLQDSVPATATSTLGIDIAPVVDIAADNRTTAEDTSVTYNALGNDSFSDPSRSISAIDGQAIVAGGPAITVANGRVTLGTDQRLTFTPDADYNGRTSYTYTVSAGGSTETAIETITVTAVNDAPAPVGTLPAQATTDAARPSIATAGGFRDADGDRLVYTATGLPTGLAIDRDSGVISGLVDRSASQANGGRYAISVTATDPSGLQGTQSFVLDVSNPAPVAGDDAASTHVDTPIDVAVLANDSDPDGDPLTVIAATADRGTVTILADNRLRFTPPAGYLGATAIRYTISDGQGGTSQATLTVTTTNTAPTAQAIPAQTGADGGTVTLDVADRFADADGDALTFSATGLPAGLAIDRTSGRISGTIDRSASQVAGGVYDAVVTVDDRHGGTASTTLRFTVTNPAPTAADDTATTAEDTPVRIAPLGNDRDPDGDPLTIVAAVADHGRVTINPDGTLDYTPDADFNGSDTIRYTVSDGQGGTADARVAVTVTPVNDAPTTTGIAPRSDPDSATVSFPTAGAFADVDSPTLTYSATGLPDGLTIDPATGVISGSITPGAVYRGPASDGRYTASVTATDGAGASVTTVFTWTVTAVGPTARDDTASGAEDTPVRVDVTANDSDGDADPLTIVAADATNGTVVIDGGSIVFTPDRDFNGQAIVTYTIADPAGNRSTATATITVMPVNDAPTAQPIPAATANDADRVTLAVGGFFGDVDGDALRFTATGLPAGLSIDPASGTISGTVDRSASQSGPYTVTVTATDPSGASASSGFSWTIVNPAPIATDDRATTAEDTGIRIPVLANDSDPDGDPLTIVSATADHGGVAIVDGALVYTPDRDFNGDDVIAYTIDDGQGGRARASVLVTVTAVEDAPVVRDPATPVAAATPEGSVVRLDTAPIFADPDGDTLTYTATGLPAGLSIDPVTGVVSGSVDRSAAGGRPDGVYPVVVTTTDPSGQSASKTITLTVANPAPIAADDTATTAEDTSVRIPVLANDSDPDGDPLTIVSATAPNGSVAIVDGALVYTPNRDFNGQDVVTYTIDDGQGGRASARVTVTVTPVDDAPVSLLPGTPVAATAAEGQAIRVEAAPAFRDVDGDTLTYAATGLPAGLSIDPVTGVVSGTIDRSAAGATPGGLYQIAVTATDPAGLAATARVTLTVTNPAPVAVDDTATTNEDTSVRIPVLANDTDPDGDPLTIVSATAPNGSVAIVDGALVYTPNRDFNGQDVVTYTIDDGQGGTAIARVTVTVVPVNDAPIVRDPATPVVATTPEGSVVSIDTAPGFADVDGDTLAYTATGLPAGLTIDPATGIVSGTIDRSASAARPGGVYTVTVTATDPAGQAASRTITLTVANPAPVARDDTASTGEDTSVRIPVLANDSDPDGDPLTIVSATAPNGSVTIVDDALVYTPNRDFNGQDIVTYTIDDGQGGRSSATVTVTVAPVDDAPVVRDPAAQLDGNAPEGGVVRIDTAPAFADADGDTLTYAATGLPAGLAIDPATGVISGTIDRSAAGARPGGVYAIDVTATDPAGLAATTRITLTIANPAPVAVDGSARTAEDTPVVIPALANASDPDGDPLTIVSATATSGSVTINPDGTLSYRPNANFAGTDTIRYRVSDGQGGTAAAVVTVTVDPVNDAPVVPVRDVPVDAVGGRPVRIDALAGVTDAEGDALRIVAASSANGVVAIGPDGQLVFTPALGFFGVATVTYTVTDGNGGFTDTTIVVRVADGRGADINALLRIGQVRFVDPAPSVARIAVPDGIVRNPLSLLATVDQIRALRGTNIDPDSPVTAAVAGMRSLRSTFIDPDAPIAGEVARLAALADFRDRGDRLFDQRWGDFVAKPLAGFSAAADGKACIMIESVVRDGAIQIEVRDTAADDRAGIRSVDIRMANGRRVPDWIHVDHRGYAIVERSVEMDEIHLIVRVTRTDGRTSSTPIVIQGATGEIEIDRHHGRARPSPLDSTLHTPRAAAQAEAARLASLFE